MGQNRSEQNSAGKRGADFHGGDRMGIEEKLLLEMLRGILTGQEKWIQQEQAVQKKEIQQGQTAREKWIQQQASPDWEKLASMAERHGVLPLLFDALAEEKAVPTRVRSAVEAAAGKTVRQSYHLLFLCKYVIGRLRARNIPVVLLKGVGTASFYPVPELRKAGDVDLLLLEPEKLEESRRVLEDCGCVVQEIQPSLHHVVFLSGDGIEIELHTMLAEPFDNNGMNRYLEQKIPECRHHVRERDVMGVPLPVLDTAFHGYELLLHMLQHFLRSGFGLKLLCDWVVFWNRELKAEEKRQYLSLVEESGIKGFSDMVTLVCCKYLGLSPEAVEWMGVRDKTRCKGSRGAEDFAIEDFLTEILEAEEFGKSGAERMVALRGGGLWDYIREFHHQMHLNFPKAGKCVPLWPALWGVTLGRFLRNNRRIRGVSAAAVFRKAGQRGRLIKQMGLWKQG